MKALKCEMCGQTDLVKQDGFFVCQFCGTKYTVEEAKKMMIEGTVDVQGTVKIDNTSFVEKYLANARRARQKEDWEETEKYYNLVEQNDPTNIEAIFYSSYGKAKASLVDADLYKRQAAFKVLKNCISILDDNFDEEKEESERCIIEQISSDILTMTTSTYVYNYRKNGYGFTTWSDSKETLSLFRNLQDEFCVTLENIAKKISDRDRKKRVFYYELALKHATKGAKEMTYYKLIKEIDPSRKIPEEVVKKSEPYEDRGKTFRKVALLIIIIVVMLFVLVMCMGS